MSQFIDPTGQPTFGIGICGRCSRKFPLAELHDDPNTPGLKVCEADMDEFDPYRLPARMTERIALPFTRPDESLSLLGVAPTAGGGAPLSLMLVSSTSTSVTLGWEPPDGSFPVYYRVYRSVDGGAYSLLADSLPLLPTTYTDSTVDRTAHFYDYRMTYVDIFGGESDPSNTVHVGLALTVASMVTLRNIYHSSGDTGFTYSQPGGCDVQLVPTNFNQSSLPITPVYPKPTSGKYYFEAKCTSISSRPNSGANAQCGLSGQVQYQVGSQDTGTPTANAVVFYDTYEGGTAGGIWDGASMNNIVGGSLIVNDVLNVAIDYSVNKMWFGKNGVWKGPGTQDPATGQGGFTPPNTTTLPTAGATAHNQWGIWHTADLSTTPETLQYRFTRSFWTYAAPAGFNNEYLPYTLGPASLSAPAYVDPNPGTWDFQNFIPGFAIAMLASSAFGNRQFRGGQQRGSGKRYFEITLAANATTTSVSYMIAGVCRASASSTLGVDDSGVGIDGGGKVSQALINHGVYGTTNWYGQSLAAGGIDARSSAVVGGGDTLMVAVDFTAQKVWFGVNGVWLDFQDPTSGAGGIALGSVATDWVIALSCNGSAGGGSLRWQFNSGGLAFLYRPSGYLGWDE